MSQNYLGLSEQQKSYYEGSDIGSYQFVSLKDIISQFMVVYVGDDKLIDKARKIVSQAIDLQKMNGKKNSTMPIIFSGTGGLALIPTQMLEKEDLKISYKDNQVLIFNMKRKSFQILNEAS